MIDQTQAPPEFYKDIFSCPHCHIASTQRWFEIYTSISSRSRDPDQRNHTLAPHPKISINVCNNCKNQTIWYDKKIIYPIIPSAPLPHDDMPDNVKADYLEACEIMDKSPRAAAALLRLALEKLLPQIGGSGKSINEQIGSLVRKGLDEHIQQSLDIVRVMGNEAVHPGVIDLKDDTKTALLLFDLINLIVETRIHHPKKINSLYQKLPSNLLDAIMKRDKK